MSQYNNGKQLIIYGNGRVTIEGGYAIRMINDTGAPTEKGYLVEADATLDNAFEYAAGGDVDPCGVVYEAGIPAGEYAWIVVSGIAYVYYSGNVARGTFSRVPTAGEGLTTGYAINEALPTAPFSTDKHFQEIGHPIENRTGAGLALTVVHFN